jgi:arylsulfatase A-like enzyme
MSELPAYFGSQPNAEEWDFKDILNRVTSTYGEDALTSKGDNGRLSDAITHDPLMDKLHKLYRGGAYDTDAGFGEFLEILERAGLSDAPMIFTSDHGEAFGEHNIFGHANNCFEETIRIPLAIRAPGFSPRVSSVGVSLIDLGPTICEFADVPVPEVWEGHSLVRLLNGQTDDAETRRMFTFECPGELEDLPADFALREGQYKLMGSLDTKGLVIEGSLLAFDLSVDPEEGTGIPVSEATPWMHGLMESLEEELKSLQISLHPAREVNLSEEEAERLRKMGYLGG